jgi:hypothetical protein
MLEWLEERCDRWGAELYAASRDLHRDFARSMKGRGFVPSEQVFVARIEGVDWLCHSQKLPNGKTRSLGNCVACIPVRVAAEFAAVRAKQRIDVIRVSRGSRIFRLSRSSRACAGAPGPLYD